ncbi:hypothetical protein SAMN02745911_1190 [Aureimonas altamirensis DSM 21988]|uniref:Uncharacterized protein n=2 Tax=Aureimonas altamirensis TaxID=370622 RepID=A0A0P0YX26_9HYPH|nr:hypothetical protein [Aureimonas altamirensis]BAT26045.1 hypothetical protein [Aureimonas altamirensis]SHI79531.1 hypothetical protein SAMN02745911_1190 [Aureimonas altamirensis DSM 21988]
MTAPKARLDTLLDGLGVRLLPVWKRRKGAQSHARATMYEVMREHGEDHLALVIRFIRDSGEGDRNKTALWSETIGAMSDVMEQRPDWMTRATDVFEALDSIDLNDLRRRAVLRRPWPVRQTLRAYLYSSLEARLDSRVDKDLFGEAA